MKSLSRSLVVLLCALILPLQPSAGQVAEESCRSMDYESTSRFVPDRVPLEMETIPVDRKNSAGLQFPDKTRIAIAALVTSGQSSRIQSRYQYVFVSETRFYLDRMLVPAGMVGIALDPVEPDAPTRGMIARDFMGAEIQHIDLELKAGEKDSALALIPEGEKEFVLQIGKYSVKGRQR